MEAVQSETEYGERRKVPTMGAMERGDEGTSISKGGVSDGADEVATAKAEVSVLDLLQLDEDVPSDGTSAIAAE